MPMVQEGFWELERGVLLWGHFRELRGGFRFSNEFQTLFQCWCVEINDLRTQLQDQSG
jgi:hypothetical protein